jgi:hydrogenase maturation protease
VSATVLGVGQPLAGDDAVGWVVARALGERGYVARLSGDASVLVSLLGEGERVVVVDAVVGGGAPGDVLRVDLEAIQVHPASLSSHGLSVIEAIELACALYGPAVKERVAIVGVVIEPPGELGGGLSASVRDAVERASALAEALARAQTYRFRSSP